MHEASSEEQAAKPTSIDGLDELRSLVGQRLGRSGWLAVDQALIDGFATLTRDEQWIHVDPLLASDGPFSTTIAHGFLTLALCSHLVSQSFVLHGITMTVNYGVDRVRFPSPVPAGASVRATVDLASVHEVPGGVQAVLHTVVTVADADKPSCVADIVIRYYV
jgi:acyl dehydratase